MPRRRNENSGQFEEVYDQNNILELLEDNRMATSEIADALGCHRTTAHGKLTRLENEELVESTQAGNTYIWEVSEP